MKQIGEKVIEKVETVGLTLRGVVVYVHPRNRYYTVRFDFGDVSFRESFTDYKYVPINHHEKKVGGKWNE